MWATGVFEKAVEKKWRREEEKDNKRKQTKKRRKYNTKGRILYLAVNKAL